MSGGGKKTGNVKVQAQKKSKEANPVPKEVLKSGDLVRMTPEAVKSQRWATSSPRILISSGWPNEFSVREAFDHKDEGPCVELDECCLKRFNPDGDYACGGHPMGLFEKVDRSPNRPFQPGDARASVTVPFLGELVGYEYRADEKKAVFRIGGQEMEAVGNFAEILNDVIKKHGVV